LEDHTREATHVVPKGNYVIAGGVYVIENPSNLGNHVDRCHVPRPRLSDQWRVRAPLPGDSRRRRHTGGRYPRSASTDARTSVIYEYPECETRYLDERRCPDCNLFTRRIGPGGSCPHCDEPVA
jgi:hypothetical protein